MPDEAEKAPFATMMYAHRYQMIPMTETMTVWCIRAPETGEETE